MRSGPGAARTILRFHTIRARPSKKPRMVGSTFGVYSFGLIFVSARTNKRHHHPSSVSDAALPAKCTYAQSMTLTRAAAAAFGPVDRLVEAEEDALTLLNVAFAVLLPPVAERDGQRPEEPGGLSRPGLTAALSSASLHWMLTGLTKWVLNVDCCGVCATRAGTTCVRVLAPARPSTPLAASDLCTHPFTAPGVVADDAAWRWLHIFGSASPGCSPGGCDPSSACMVDKSSLPTGSRRRMAAGWVSTLMKQSHSDRSAITGP